MELNGGLQVFAVGCLGGALVEVTRWYNLRIATRVPRYLKSVRYWLLTLAMIICGGIVAVLYGIKQVSALLAVNLGASAPLIVSTYQPLQRQVMVAECDCVVRRKCRSCVVSSKDYDFSSVVSKGKRARKTNFPPYPKGGINETARKVIRQNETG